MGHVILLYMRKEKQQHCIVKKQDPPLQNNALNTQEKWTYMTQNGIELFQIQ